MLTTEQIWIIAVAFKDSPLKQVDSIDITQKRSGPYNVCKFVRLAKVAGSWPFSLLFWRFLWQHIHFLSTQEIKKKEHFKDTIDLE